MSVLSQFFGGGNQVSIELWAVGGGGGGSGNVQPGQCGGGGGAGQVLYSKILVQKNIAFTIAVGGGGGGGVGAALPNAPVGSASAAGNSSIFSNMVAYGGSGARDRLAPGALQGAISFGSGGGGNAGPGIPNNSANNIDVTGSITSDGYVLFNNGAIAGSTNGDGGGGGGALFAAIPVPLAPLTNGKGGAGIPASLFGISLDVGGGGSGGSFPPAAVTGGLGGGGDAGNATPPGPVNAPGKNGTANTGGGGGGASGSAPPAPGGNGGSGIVVIRYPTSFAAATVTGNTPTPAQPGYNVYRWNSGPATITFN
jgi:hypothetical protein